MPERLGNEESGEGGNIFDDLVRVGVGITFFIRNSASTGSSNEVSIYSVDDYLDSGTKRELLESAVDYRNIPYATSAVDSRYTWVTEGLRLEYDNLLTLGDKAAKSSKSSSVASIFKTYSLGISTNRDSVVYDFAADLLATRMSAFANEYNSEVDRYKRSGQPKDLDSFLSYDKIKWSRNLKRELRNQHYINVDTSRIQRCLYRPFAERYLYFGGIAVDEYGQMEKFFPTDNKSDLNRVICVSDKGFRSLFSTIMAKRIVDLHVCAGVDGYQCFSFYTYNEDGTNRRENITDWALEQFRTNYNDKSITKWDIFHYVYAVLHHPLYRERYAANLKRELPRIPFAPDFRAFADIGKRLAEIHVNYEEQPEYALERIEKPGAQLDWRVERMKLSKDKRSLIYNDFLTLSGIPPEVFEYRLGNRSGLDWIIDQYQVSTDKRSGITNDPNRAGDPEYIVRLVGQVITVSLETVKLANSLADLPILANIDK